MFKKLIAEWDLLARKHRHYHRRRYDDGNVRLSRN